MNYTENVKTKSLGLAIVLTLLFGPLGLFYASVSGGLIMSLTPLALLILLFLGAVSQSSILLASSAILLGIFALSYWIICVIWAATSISNYNNQVINDARQEELSRILEENNRINNQIVPSIITKEIIKVSDDQNIDQPTIKAWQKQNPHRSINDYYQIYGVPQSPIITPTHTFDEAYFPDEKSNNSLLYITLAILIGMTVFILIFKDEQHIKSKFKSLFEKRISKEEEAQIKKRNMIKWLSKTWIYEKTCLEEKIKRAIQMSHSNKSMNKLVHSIGKETMKVLKTLTFRYISTGDYITNISNSKESLTENGSWEFNNDFTKIFLTIDKEKRTYDIKELTENSLKLSYIDDGEERIESFVPYKIKKVSPVDNSDYLNENSIESGNDNLNSINLAESIGTEWEVQKNESELLYACFQDYNNPDLKISVCFDKNIKAKYFDKNLKVKFVKHQEQDEVIPLFFQNRQTYDGNGDTEASVQRFWSDTYTEKYRGKITGSFTFTNSGFYGLEVYFIRKRDGKEFHFRRIEGTKDENNENGYGFTTTPCF